MSQISPNPNDGDDDEDPIVAEVRRARTAIFARFNYDLRAFFDHLRARTEESARAGRKVAPLPPGNSLAQPPSAKKAG